MTASGYNMADDIQTMCGKIVVYKLLFCLSKLNICININHYKIPRQGNENTTYL